MDAGIAAELLTTITGMAGATKAVAEAMKSVKSKVKGNAEAEQALSGAMDHVLTLQTRMIDLQATVLSLQQELAQAQHENANLREQIRSEEVRAEERKKYKLQKRRGDASVLVREDQPDTSFCPTCFAKGHQIPLQPHPMRHHHGSLFCSSCETTFHTRP
jgi:chromosome segregation ATPase